MMLLRGSDNNVRLKAENNYRETQKYTNLKVFWLPMASTMKPDVIVGVIWGNRKLNTDALMYWLPTFL